MTEETKKPQQIETIVNTGTIIGSVYSQIARVTVGDDVLTIEFGYVHPANLTQGQSVARITMPIRAGLKLAELILQVKRIHEKKKERKRND
jgi:hypothetical protein